MDDEPNSVEGSARFDGTSQMLKKIGGVGLGLSKQDPAGVATTTGTVKTE